MRDVIFQKALELFSEKGYAGTSMRELARRCGTTPSNVYNYYPSKENLLREVFQLGAEQIYETLESGQDGGDVDRAHYLRQVLKTIDENRPLWRMIHQLRHNEEVRTLLEPDFATLLEAVVGDLAVYSSAPWLLLAIVDGLAASRLQGLPMPPDEVVVETVIRCLESIDAKP